ncbi:MAG: hypothetical protein U0X74_16450 [Anaerolineales bacterium]
MIESYQQQTDEAVLRKVCDNIRGLLMRADWRDQLHKTREQMPKQDGDMAAPLADMILQVQSELSARVDEPHQSTGAYGQFTLCHGRSLRRHSARPILPLHIIMGDLLVQEGHTADAIAKFSVVAHSYSARRSDASKLLRRIIQISPWILGRNRLIDQFVARGRLMTLFKNI